MTKHNDFKLTFDFFDAKPIVVEVTEALFSSEAGLLPIRQFDQQIGLPQRFAKAIEETRHPSYVIHSPQGEGT